MAGFIFRNERLSETALRAFRPPSSARVYLCYGNGFLKCTRERGSARTGHGHRVHFGAAQRIRSEVARARSLDGTSRPSLGISPHSLGDIVSLAKQPLSVLPSLLSTHSSSSTLSLCQQLSLLPRRGKVRFLCLGADGRRRRGGDISSRWKRRT